MRMVLLSGGSGKRLWPLSNDARSKQFLPVLESPAGTAESMVQRVWRQLSDTGLQERACIATSKSQVEMIHAQLGHGTPIVVEPQRRDTFPAIALAAAYLYSVQGVSLEETIVVMPVDPFVETAFYDTIASLPHVLADSGADLALIGVQPTYPSEKYGYIVPERGTSTGGDGLQVPAYSRVSRFQEKPRKEEATVLIEQAALWNCGVFAFRLDYLINLLIAMELPIQYEEMARQYAKLPAISFDFQVVERAADIAVTPYAGEWRDLGTWNTLTEEMKQPLVGKGILTEDCHNTHLINELDIPIAVVGLSDVIVAASPDGILVSDKSASPRIKEVLKPLEGRPMYEQRRWGHYRIIDHLIAEGGEEVLTKRIAIRSGCNLSYQLHLKRSEIWTIVSGTGELVQDGVYRRVGAGDVVRIPAGSHHSIRAVTNLEIIEVQSGPELIEEDIIRLHMDWEEILQVSRA
ncbi:sugar phosphate nucleotidyltransferase [Paenibacillus sp. 1P07SE]|uniref:sugar phosphate nucleotidyltransferase n=1 Tax=Paenibacillus sp. 1P07SE TaxID=3132209 RepID=UPI0039A53AF1